MTATETGFRIVRFGEVEWEPRTEDQWPCLVKRLVIDQARDLAVVIVWYARGMVEPRHVHNGTHAAWVLVGTAQMDGQTIGPWDIVFGPGRVPHGPLLYENGCLLFGTLSGGALHTAVGEDHAAPPSDGLPAQVVVGESRPWSAPGDNPSGWPFEQRLMIHDQARDYSARLVRWPAGSVAPRHIHPGSHAALILSGRAEVDGRRLGPWDLIYGPGGVPHGPISFPEGCTLAVSAKGDLAAEERGAQSVERGAWSVECGV